METVINARYWLDFMGNMPLICTAVTAIILLVGLILVSTYDRLSVGIVPVVLAIVITVFIAFMPSTDTRNATLVKIISDVQANSNLSYSEQTYLDREVDRLSWHAPKDCH